MTSDSTNSSKEPEQRNRKVCTGMDGEPRITRASSGEFIYKFTNETGLKTYFKIENKDEKSKVHKGSISR